MQGSKIKAISYYLPEGILTNEHLHERFPEWSMGKIAEKTGIINRHIAHKDEFVSDMAVKAAKSLFAEYTISPDDVEFIILCTQTPDYYLPTTACIVQNKLGVPNTAGALDFNMGCSGFIYGLSLAKGLIGTGQVKNVLLITAETYSKHIAEGDKSVRTLFGDGAAATFLEASDLDAIGKFEFGTDGKGAENLIVRNGSIKEIGNPKLETEERDQFGNVRTWGSLYMNGGEVFTFTLSAVPDLVAKTLLKNDLDLTTIDLVIMHQANRYMLEALRKIIQIPSEKFFLFLEDCGNTVSSTIPIALKEAVKAERITDGMKVLVVGFGVGYSWAGTIIYT